MLNSSGKTHATYLSLIAATGIFLYGRDASQQADIKKLESVVAGDFSVQLQKNAARISEQSLESYKQQVLELAGKIESDKRELANLKATRERFLRDLPEAVSLDDIVSEYSERTSKAKNPYSTAVTFLTMNGEIEFTSSDIQIAKIPSSKIVAWVRIGKKSATDKQITIKSWLKEAEIVKIQNGYKKIYEKTRPTAYGQITETFLEKDDMYFKTSFQSERMLESYGRYSMAYTFYSEIGSKSRSAVYLTEQYTYALGS